MNVRSDRPYAVDISLRWSDMDAYGHVNNVEFLRLLEQARVIGFQDWFGGRFEVLEHGVVVARQEIEYLAPLEFRRAPVSIDMWVSRIAGSSYDLGYEVRDPVDIGDQVYARAETTLVSYDLVHNCPRKLTDIEREVLNGVRGEPVALRGRSV